MTRRVLLLTVLLAACQTVPPESGPSGGAVISQGQIETDASGRCYARTERPTETVVVEDLVEVVPEIRDRNGVVTSPAVFRSVTRPQIKSVGDGLRFETVCPQRLTAEVVLTLQRALIVRRAYDGPVNGLYDSGTRAAVQAVQRPAGIDSPLLSVDLARALGVVAVPRELE